ncbi:hypothetical protein [Shewanella cyperi]|uniref:hypothetical protein n=1 Tax=Shewanella cyperi TaxID=2814292 RepID=UPI001A93D1B7|nr:hypothetical protein [Shewanella cyperi]QSX39783.1 hypothetical protein JYB84_12260 [Shewanella cyperi]
MGTAQEQQRRKRKQIKEILNKLQLSIPNFAGLVYEALYVDDCGDFGVSNTDEERKFAGKIKKQLSRSTTPEALLDKYLEVLIQQPGYEALKLGYIQSRYVPHPCLSDELTEVMTQLSAELDTRAELD